jgi:hypothetical protein
MWSAVLFWLRVGVIGDVGRGLVIGDGVILVVSHGGGEVVGVVPGGDD